MSKTKKLTPQDVLDRVNALHENHWDDEKAHNEEDSLYLDILTAIANGTIRDAKACAEIAIGTKNIQFHRWYA